MSDRSVSSRSRWLSHGSAAVLAAALTMAAHSEASAQAIGPRIDNTRSVQADLIVQPPGVTVATGATQDVITVDNPATILNWTVLDTATIDTTTDFVNFLPQNTAVNFDSSLTDFTVLNRIIPTANGAGQFRGIAINGAVTSTATVSGPPVTAGNIWFYSPGGILVGSGASFNVGSVVLTTSDIQVISGGPRIDFTGVSDPMSAVTIQQGANITVPVEGGSAVFFAPTINQGGVVDVNGSVLYMSAEEGSVFDNGVNGFNFFTSFGGEAEAGNGIFHTGTTTGPASLGTATIPDLHIIDFFARGADLNILIEGTVGYQPATMASQDVNGTIRLGSGLDAAGSLELGSLTLNSTTTFEAGSINLNLGAGEAFQAAGDAQGTYSVTLTSNDTQITVNPGGMIDILGNFTADRISADGGELSVSVIGDATNALPDAEFNIGGDFEALFGVTFVQSSSDPLPLSAGAVSFDISGGAIVDVGGDLRLLSNFEGGERNNNGVLFLPDAIGGEVSLTMTGTDSQLLVGGEVRVDASAESFASSVALGAPSVGGTATIDITEGTVAADRLTADADGRAAGGFSDPAPRDGTGGTAIINLGDAAVDVSGISATANGQGAFASQGIEGGAGFGGTARLTKGSGGSFDVGSIEVQGRGEGGGGNSGGAGLPGTTGGEGTGGVAELMLGQNPNGLSQLSVLGDGRGGGGGFSGIGQVGGTGGRGVGGTAIIEVTANEAVLVGLADTSFNASGTGGSGGGGGGSAAGVAAGDGGRGGQGVGGEATLDIGGAGALYTFDGTLSASAAGQGGSGGFGGTNTNSGTPGTGGDGGDGISGISRLTSRDGAEFTFNGFAFNVGAFAFGGDGGLGGNITFNSGVASSAGGEGGSATGGSLILSAAGGSFTGANVPFVSRGNGGDGGNGGGDGTLFFGVGPEGASGDATGGDVVFELLDGGASSFSFGDVTVDSIASAGSGTGTGNTVGGTLSIIDNSTDPAAGMTFNSLTATVDAMNAPGQPSFSVTGTNAGINITNDFTVDVSGDAVFNFAGDGQLVVGGQVQVDSGQDILITHTNNAGSIASIQSDGSIVMTASGDFNAGVDTLLSAAGDVDILASGIAYGFVSAGQSVTLDSLSGIGGGAIDAVEDINLFAVAEVSVDDLDTGGIVLIDAGDIAVGDVTAATVDFTTGLNILFDSITAGSAVTLDAPNGAIAANTFGPGDIATDQSVTLTAGSINVGTVAAGQILDAAATGDAIFAGLDVANNATIVAPGLVSIGDATVGERLVVNSFSNVAITEDSILNIGTMQIGENLFVETGSATLGSGQVGGQISVDARFGGIDVTGDNLTANLFTFRARRDGADINFNTLTTLDGRVRLDAGRDVTGQTIISADDVSVDARNLVAIETIDAQDSAFITGDGGVTIDTITVAQGANRGFLDIGSGGDIIIGSLDGAGGEVDAGGDLRIEDDLSTTSNFVVSANDVFVRSTNTPFIITVRANAGNIDIQSQGDINVEGAQATGDVNIRTSGALVANDVFAFMFQSQPLPPGVQTVQQTTSSGGSVTLSGDASLTINAAVDAASGVELETFGLLTVNDSVIGEGITVFADDIVITADGSIGDASRTFAIDFQTQGSVRFGGPAAGGSGTFEIDNDELTRISSGGSLSVSALGVSPGDTPSIRVFDTDIFAGSNTGNFGQDSVLELISDGSISFSGNLNVTGANANTDIVLDALTAVNIELSSGGIFVADANGALAGEVIVNATDFRALSDGVGPEIANATVAEIDMILSNNRGVDRPDGVITADTLTIATTASQVFIQNTAPGTEFEERRGFTVNNLNISTGGTDPQPIVINGIVNGLTGVEAIAPTNITSTVAAGSTINGCAILNTAACTGTTPPPPTPPAPPPVTPTPSPEPTPEGEIPVRDIIEEEVRDPEEEEGIDGGGLDKPLIDLEGLDDPAGAPLIDDPVTGAGNEDLWEPAE